MIKGGAHPEKVSVPYLSIGGHNMACILGIDLGTSSVKAMLLDEYNGIIGVASQSYTVDIPVKGYAQQSPDMWWGAVKSTVRQLEAEYKDKFNEIRVVGYSGQMHGLVLTGSNGAVLYPAIIWMDQRSKGILEKVTKDIGKEKMGEIFHNRLFSGFAFASLLWIKEYEPYIFEQIYKVLMPKDYIRFCMTGEYGTDASDASSSCMFNIGERDWAWEIIRKCGVPQSIFPKVHESTEIAGVITELCALETGLPVGIPVVYGCGDQPAQSIGNGGIAEGILISNIGTGAQISTYSNQDIYDRKLRLHTFCHALNKAHTIFGATLCGGLSMNWLKDSVLGMKEFYEMSDMVKEVEPGSEGLIYLPYLTGERTPHMNPDAKGMFFGLCLKHDRKNFIRSVMEGVTFSLKDSMEIFEQMGLKSDRIIASGGGASSSVWLQIQADILEKEIYVCKVKEQACLGACILAGIGSGILKSAEDGVERFVSYRHDCYEPRKQYQNMYREQHEMYQNLYVNNVEIM